MDQIFLRPDLLPPTVPAPALWAFALFAVFVWAGAHQVVKRRFRDLRVRLGILIPVGTVASWTVFQLLGRYLFFAGRWHLLFASLVAGGSLELVSWLYQREAARIASPRIRRIVVACRMAAIALLVFVIMQPELVGEKERTIKRRVVVLMDDSASMHFRDKYWTDEERLDMAAALGVLEVSGEDSLESLPDDLAGLQRAFSDVRSAAEKGPAAIDGPALLELAERARGLAAGAAETMDRLLPKIDAKTHGDVARALPARAEFIRKTLLPPEMLRHEGVRRRTFGLWGKLAVGVVPILLIGVAAAKLGWMEAMHGQPLIMAGALFIGGVLLLRVEEWCKTSHPVSDLAGISYRTAFLIGVFQCLAIVPGTSRSAVTIVGALALGLARPPAAEFSFLLAVPTMTAASAYSMLKYHGSLTGGEWAAIGMGSAVAFLVSLFAVSWLMRFVKTHTFELFGWYRMALALTVAGYFFLKL